MTLNRKVSVWLLALLGGVLATAPLRAGPPPPWLPTYQVVMDLDIARHQARVQMHATWTNHHTRPTQQLVFNVHSRYVVPVGQVGLVAKTLEILRVNPGEALGYKEPPCEIHKVLLGNGPDAPALNFHFEGDTGTTLVVPLPTPVQPGQSVTVLLDLTMHLPCKQGRWGHWRDVTFLSNWLPVFAYHGDAPPPKASPESAPASPSGFDPNWQPTPFVPWHQPFFNEAGNYRVRVRLPADQKIACTGTIASARELPDGWREVEILAAAVRDFAFLCSASYQEHKAEVVVSPGQPPVRIHVLALPQHDHYAKEMLRISAAALEKYSKWFGPYPYQDFTIAEAFFGWNGNECSTLVMIDERVFGMPHLAVGYVEYLVAHEICHQWWYNMVGTNGYCETWMDEALATYFSHKVLDETLGKNNVLMKYPRGLEWLPNIRRNDYRCYGMYGTIGRGEIGPCVQPMPDHGHVVNLFSNCYDKGSRVVGLIEERLHGWEGFQPFIRQVFLKYQYRILRVADFQRELEAYTGQSWEEFFQNWLYSKRLSDWAVADVVVQPPPSACLPAWKERHRAKKAGPPTLDNPQDLTRVVVYLEQHAEINEQTTLGISLPGKEGYVIRIPVLPQAGTYHLPDPPTRFETVGENRFRIEILLPEEPTQVAVDPDQVGVDKDPANNFWHRPCRCRFSPIYTFLEETDLTNSYDRWNFIWGPWIYGASYNSPWYTRATLIGARAGVFRTQEFSGGVYTAYRTDYRDAVAGVDGVWDHWPGCRMQVGFNAEQRLGSVYQAYDGARRAAVYARYVFQYASSLYLPPMNYLEAFTSYTDNFLPFTRGNMPGGERWNHAKTMGLHYQLNYLTPYWDPEGGFLFDAYYQGGLAELGPNHSERGFQQVAGQFSLVKSVPNCTEALRAFPRAQQALKPALEWLADTRLDFHAFGGIGFPSQGEFFSLGGSQMFRGFDMRQRQGSAVWVANLEWRVPVARDLNWDCFDHVMGVRNLYAAAFYDVGDAYVRNRQVAPLAHALGAGLRVDTAWFGFVERSVIRLDFAKALNESTPWQVWFGFMHPF